DWLKFFVPFGVMDSGFIQSTTGGSGLDQGYGFTMLFNFSNGKVNVPGLPQYSNNTTTTFRIEDQSGNIVNLVRDGTNWKADIPSGATKLRFLYQFNGVNGFLMRSPFIELNTSYNKFYISFSADITYSNITDTW
ncbi:hypothetical protein N9P53_01385, partial [Flavobacteriaceae bacterium]|nr:hypothetical protein [Flavobacteriaceae bacterium]